MGDSVLTSMQALWGNPFPGHHPSEEVALAGGMALSEVRALGHEGKALAVMIAGAIRCAKGLHKRGRSRNIRSRRFYGNDTRHRCDAGFPIGFPKVMISSMAPVTLEPLSGQKIF